MMKKMCLQRKYWIIYTGVRFRVSNALFIYFKVKMNKLLKMVELFLYNKNLHYNKKNLHYKQIIYNLIGFITPSN
jgi:hypothetical protein